MEVNFNVNAHVHYAHGELAEVRCLLGKIMSTLSQDTRVSHADKEQLNELLVMQKENADNLKRLRLAAESLHQLASNDANCDD